MQKKMRYLALDVHADTMHAAVAEADGDVRDLGVHPHRPEAVRKLVAKLGPRDRLRVCYEAGPTGYPLYWQLTALGIHCDVIAPTLIPTKAGDRVKTDRRDALRLARAYRAGDLTAVWVPDAATEALRDLVRAREVTKQDQLRARHRVNKFLLRHGRHRPDGLRAWTGRHARWLATQRFESAVLQTVFDEYCGTLALLADRLTRLEAAITEALTTLAPAQQALVGALSALRGIRQVTAATLVSEVGTLRRFATARQLMGYAGLVPRDHSSAVVRARQRGQPPGIIAVATAAQHRRAGRYRRLAARGKPPLAVSTTIARELLGFIWALGQLVEPAPAPVGGPRMAS